MFAQDGCHGAVSASVRDIIRLASYSLAWLTRPGRVLLICASKSAHHADSERSTVLYAASAGSVYLIFADFSPL